MKRYLVFMAVLVSLAVSYLQNDDSVRYGYDRYPNERRSLEIKGDLLLFICETF